MPRYRFRGHEPQIPASTFVAETASVIGRVILGENTSVWPGAVIRADSEPITIGEGSNVQDNAVLHVDPGVPMTIGPRVTIGHQVMLHGCTVGDGSLIGIKSVVMNGAKIGRNCLVGAGSLVTEGKEFPDGSMIMGAPAKVVRELTPEQIAGLQRAAAHYVANAQRFRAGLKKIA